MCALTSLWWTSNHTYTKPLWCHRDVKAHIHTAICTHTGTHTRSRM